MKVSEIMTKDPIKVKIMTPIKEVAKLMRDKSVSSVIIVKNEKPIGIVTERDLVRRVMASDRDLNRITAFDICSKPVVAVSEISEIDDAVELMKKNKIRRVVVVDSSDRVVGILTTDDIGYNLKSLSEDLAIKYVTIMKRQMTGYC
ncbi:CBS domain-containing protein [Candidatus Bathyarchaeota archaeon]|nr:CBS domain-containing protein [Candidatus Bathyarchaeota archaeon]MBS7629957.1 CBS domain-containing protein [Candidatus Bathyarchaeota archaeon]